MWSLGMILHKLIFFRLPYPDVDPADVNGIEREVLAYPGWKAAADPGVVASCKRRGLPRELLLLLEGLLCRNPRERPSSDRVLSALKEGNVCGVNDAHDCSVDCILQLESHTRVTKKHDVSSSRPRRGSSSSPSVERSGFPPEALTLTLIKPSDMPLPDTLTDEEGDIHSHSTSPVPAKLRPGSRRPSLADSLTTLLLPAPVQALRRRRWRNVKMSLLVLKIVSLSRACRGGSPAMWIQALATSLAVIDIWKDEEAEGDEMDDLRLSLALCFVHFVLLGLIRWSRLGLCIA
jgi:serine/threonine protein kinase